MVKGKTKGFLSGLIVLVLIFSASATAFAATGTKSINVGYNNIKVYINNKLTQMLDPNGNGVEPFTYNGTTYVPLRAVSEALGQNVKWDDATKSIYVGSTPKAQAPATKVQTPAPTSVTGHLLPEIIESGYGISKGSGDINVTYGITIKNPNKDVALEFPSFRITARDENGSVIGTEDQTLFTIYPGDSITYAGQAFSTDKTPATVTFEILKPKEYNWVSTDKLKHKKYVPLQIEGATQTSGSIVGQIINNNDYDIDSANISIVFRDSDGKIIGGDSAFVDNIAASGKTPFSAFLMGGNEGKSFTVYAMPW